VPSDRGRAAGWPATPKAGGCGTASLAIINKLLLLILLHAGCKYRNALGDVKFFRFQEFLIWNLIQRFG
jgi:hypothetical protein